MNWPDRSNQTIEKPPALLSSCRYFLLMWNLHQVSSIMVEISLIDAMMNPSDDNPSGYGLNAFSRRFALLRDDVMAEWQARVLLRIARASLVQETALIDALPIIFDGLVEALTPEYPRALATSGTNLAQSHGIERARRSSYRSRDIVEEMLIFRDAIFYVASTTELVFDRKQVEIIVRSIDAAILESLSYFSTIRDRNIDLIAATLHHDIRAPLHLARASAQLIMLQSNTPVIAALAQQVSARLGDANLLIDKLLDIASSHPYIPHPLQISHFDLETMVREVTAEMGVAESVVVFTDEEFCGFWCRRSLKRAVHNLLSNAQKYGLEDTPVTIALTRFDHRVLISIHNEGQAISPAIRDRMFGSTHWLEGLDSARREVGLPLVQAVAESHGGTVIVDSDHDRGTTFSLSLPLDSRPFVAAD